MQSGGMCMQFNHESLQHPALLKPVLDMCQLNCWGRPVELVPASVVCPWVGC